MATRAIHLEVVLDNSAQQFLLASRRFIARRGTPTTIYSVNSTTFCAAENTLNSMIDGYRSSTTANDFVVNHKIKWKFITSLFPWKGGFYERMVALVKSAYRKSIGRTSLTLSQL
ncbi:hypothetical protein Q1695_006725 [Nippostrongylus brasiliensis]|nr:hypothetical protein Q1695_006725 [Nippostrongylus brasiliensis]